MNKSHIIPLPPRFTELDTRYEKRAAIGLYRCDNDPDDPDFCPEYRLIMRRKDGTLEASCSTRFVISKGCTRSCKGLSTDIPAQTYENYKAAFEFMNEHCPVPTAYKQYLEKAWTEHQSQEHSDNE